MLVHIDIPHFFPKTRWPPKTKWPPKNKMAAKTKNAHNSLNFQAMSPRFCMLVFIDNKNQNQDGRQKIKWPPKHKIDHNSVNFEARSSRFCMVVFIDLPNFFKKPRWPTKNKIAAKTQN